MTKQLACPQCGNTEEFRYREDQTVNWGYQIVKIVGDALHIDTDGEHSPFGAVGTGADPYIECVECGEGFPVPAGLKLDFMDRL